MRSDDANFIERACCAVVRFHLRRGATIWMLLIVSFFLLFSSLRGEMPLIDALLCIAALIAVIQVIPRVVWRRVQARHADAFNRDDVETVRTLGPVVYGKRNPPDVLTALGQGELLLVERRYADARDMYQKLTFNRLNAALTISVRNNLAYATAMAGDPQSAIALARSNLELVKRHPPKRPDDVEALFGTLGIALSLVGEHVEAVDHLSKLASRPGVPSNRAMQGFFLGTSLLALKRHDEAMAALDRASSFEGVWAERAKATRAESIAQPHRV
jgi:tetratricopeptide (TPR) repeat protein